MFGSTGFAILVLFCAVYWMYEAIASTPPAIRLHVVKGIAIGGALSTLIVLKASALFGVVPDATQTIVADIIFVGGIAAFFISRILIRRAAKRSG